jgi:hypothetical protein
MNCEWLKDTYWFILAVLFLVGMYRLCIKDMPK